MKPLPLEMYDEFAPRFTLLSNGGITPEPSTACVLGILEAAEDIMASSGVDHEISFEPLPLGPGGVQKLVDAVSLGDSADLLQVSRDDLRAILNPLLATSSSIKSTSTPSSRSKKRKLERPAPADSTGKLGALGGSLPPSVVQRTVLHPFAGNIIDIEEGDIVSASFDAATAASEPRFMQYQTDQWEVRFQDLVDFRNRHGHCLVPHHYPENPKLAQWIKRQRYQYKLKQSGCHSTLSGERQAMLEDMGFVWHSHRATWLERFESLKQFKALHGHCMVPANYPDKPLAIWVKCQRRQRKLHIKKGIANTTMTLERFSLLDDLGFDWNPRNL